MDNLKDQLQQLEIDKKAQEQQINVSTVLNSIAAAVLVYLPIYMY